MPGVRLPPGALRKDWASLARPLGKRTGPSSWMASRSIPGESLTAVLRRSSRRWVSRCQTRESSRHQRDARTWASVSGPCLRTARAKGSRNGGRALATTDVSNRYLVADAFRSDSDLLLGGRYIWLCEYPPGLLGSHLSLSGCTSGLMIPALLPT